MNSFMNSYVNKNKISSEGHSSGLLRGVMPELDVIRGLAILMVVFYHGFYWGLDLSHYPRMVQILLSGFWLGRLGVSLFFVLSGFLISGILLDSIARRDYYSRFYIRRGLRILPAYGLTILVLAFALKDSSRFILLSIAYLSNITPLLGVPIAYPVLWSLAVEEHFYFFWPFVIRTISMRRLIGLCLTIICISPILRAISFLASSHNGISHFFCNEYTWNSLDGLACGALMAAWLRLAAPNRSTVKRAVVFLLIGAVTLEIAALPWGIFTRQRIVGAALQVVPWHFFFSALICASLLIGTSQWHRIVQWRVLKFFGEISYGLYLYHLFAFWGVDYLSKRKSLWFVGTEHIFPLLSRFVIAFALAVCIAWISRKTIEDYFLSLKYSLTKT
jgi:peptidoglycan/LPS O-acetylase OafA/YrhL